MECTYAPEGRSYPDYRSYLNKLADRTPVQNDRVGVNIQIAMTISDQAKEAFEKGKPDVAFYSAMKAMNYLSALSKQPEDVLKQYAFTKAERLKRSKANLDIAEKVTASGGPLEKLHQRMIVHENQHAELREELLKKQFEDGELGEEEQLKLRERASAEDNEKKREFEQSKNEALREREASDKAILNRIAPSLLTGPTTLTQAPSERASDAKMNRLLEQLGGGAPPQVFSALSKSHSVPVTPPATQPALSEVPSKETALAEQLSRPNLPSGPFLQFPPLRSQVPRFLCSGSSNRVGLKNLGNTCYLNSILQCLFSLSIFRDTIADELYLPDLIPGHGRVINTLSEALANMRDPYCRTVNPSNLKHALGERNESFAGFSQQDASEFFLSLINEGDSDINAPQYRYPGGGSIEKHCMAPLHITALEAAEKHFKFNSLNSIFQRTFMFQTLSVTQCERCLRRSQVVNSELSLELPFPSDCHPTDEVDIYSMLKEYCKIERFVASSPRDSNGYKCEVCGHYVSAKRQTTLLSVPQTLVLTLKRFKHTSDFSDKISSRVTFPEVLSLKPFCHRSEGSAEVPVANSLMHKLLSSIKSDPPSWSPSQFPPDITYRLVGIVNHRGNIHGGHYTADVRDESNDCWASISDERVSRCEKPDRALAYMLFYSCYSN